MSRRLEQDRAMASTMNVTRILVGHHQRMEHALTVVRTNDTLDDRQKGQLITRVIAAGNAGAVEIMSRHRRLAAAG
jgi:hypothetical protein